MGAAPGCCGKKREGEVEERAGRNLVRKAGRESAFAVSIVEGGMVGSR